MRGEVLGNYAYGMWPAVVFNIFLFVFFAIGFIRPKKRFEWRSMGALLDSSLHCLQRCTVFLRFSLAEGSTFALLYLGCVFVMLTVGKKGTILFFNSLIHGLDVTSIIRMNMPFWEMIIGTIEIFILGWLTGATIASIYNFSLERNRK